MPQGVVCTAPPRASGPAPQARAADGSAAVCRAMQVPMSTQLRTTLGRSRPVAPGLCEPRLEFVQVSEAGTLLVPCARHPRPNLRHTLAAPHSRVACCVLLCVRIGSNHSHTLPFHVHPVHTACIPWVGHAHTDLLLELPTLCRLRAEVVDSLRVGGLHPLHVERAQHGLHTVRHKRAYIGADTCSVRILGSVRS